MMSSNFHRVIFCAALIGVPTLVGCGGRSEPVIVGGNDPKYQMPEDIQSSYEQAMKESRKSANRTQ